MGKDLMGREVESSDAVLTPPEGIEAVDHPLLLAFIWHAHRLDMKASTGVSHAYPDAQVEELVRDAFRIATMLCMGRWGSLPSPALQKLASEAVNDPELWPLMLDHCRRVCHGWFRSGDPTWTKNPRTQLGAAHRALPELKERTRRGKALAKRLGIKTQWATESTVEEERWQ